MNQNSNRTYLYIGIALIVLILLALGVYAFKGGHTAQAPTVTSTASYLCRDGKSMDAVFSDQSVTLTLSDTRAFVLPQVVSGSGIRYEKDGVVFIGKGENASLQENGETTFVDCVVSGAPSNGDSTDGNEQFTDSAGTFAFSYPPSVTVSGGDGSFTQEWMNGATSTGLVLAKATLGKAFQPKTNFSEATLTVGTSANPTAVATCLTNNPTGGPAVAPTHETINGTTYTVLHSNDAGAGNRYDTTSYRALRDNQCYVVEYTIHSTAIGNYSPDQGIKEFDVDAVEKVMDGIVHSFRFTDGA